VVLLLLKTISFIAPYKGSARSTLFAPVQGLDSYLQGRFHQCRCGLKLPNIIS
jgi:hypothetical protein